MSFGLCLFVTWTILAEFYKGARAIGAKSGRNLLLAAVELTHRNTRRYGGYIVHLGIVLMFVGFTGSAFNKDTTIEVKVGDRFALGHYEMKVADLREGDNDNYTWNRARIEVWKDGSALGSDGAGAALLQGQPAGHLGSGHPPTAQRGPVPELRRDER